MPEQVTTLISSIYPPDEGGPATFTESFSRFLLNQGTRVQIFTYSDFSQIKRLTKSFRLRRVTRRLPLIIRLPLFSFSLLLMTRRGSRVLANVAFLECIPLIFFKKVDLVTKIPGDIVWERAVAKNKTNLNVFDFQNLKLSKKYAIFRRLFLYTLNKSKFVIVPSNYLYELCVRWGVNKDRIVLLKNTVDTQRFTPHDIEKVYDLIFIGRLVGVKQIDEIIDVATRNDLSLLIVGSGPLESSLKMAVAETGGDVTFLGSVTQENLPEVICTAKIFVQNSEIEATSYALLEARSCGLISIANEMTGAAEVIRHKHDGYLFGNKHGLDLEGAVLEAIKLSGDEEKLFQSRARVDCIERFDRDRLYSLIQGLLLT